MLNLSPARAFGDMVFMLPAAIKPAVDPEMSLPLLREHMATYTEQDSLLMVGEMMLVAWAAALGARATGGVVTLLKWDKQQSIYFPNKVTLWKNEENT